MAKAKLITFSGRTQSISAWARELGIGQPTLNDRLGRYRWPLERALTKPVRKPNDKRGERKSDDLLKAEYRYDRVSGRSMTKQVAIAEKALGKPLPDGTVVHHVNYNKLDNRHSNLVICPNQKYHILLHMRTDALNASGNANFRWCYFCKKYDDPENMHQYPGDRHFMHRECIKSMWIGRKDKVNAKRRVSQQRSSRD